MSGYNGRRGPNVSSYLAELNTIHSPSDQISDQQNLEDEFAMFTNPDFGDADQFAIPLNFSYGGVNDQDLATQTNPPTGNHSAAPVDSKLDFSLAGDFHFDAGFSGFSNNPIIDTSIPDLSGSNYPVAATYTSPVSPSAVSPAVPGFDATNDEAARVAAEEDKRRRNTAASARFRIKKKQREQTLEKTAKEMTDRVNLLEDRIRQLETENAWLKGLITEKNGGKTSTSEIKAMLNKHEEGRSIGTRTDGVGTKA
ncbi:unnamed protein product [Periconia digitata]|uniref:BZIP domain-containing protein n=1 Tax=Periconia digitata TaxID=1303443 RepID=A0A9W4UPZ6_9PLEO|nr:unnamed protein product [Periconia digitata]